MAGMNYYARQPYFKGWQRFVSAIALVVCASGLGEYFERLAELRYSTFKGRTALYGDTTVRNGWLNEQQNSKDNERLSD